MLFKLLRHVRRNVVGYIALFVALGGTAVAAKPLITGANVQDGSITGADIAPGDRDLALQQHDPGRARPGRGPGCSQ
jgi:hypothetical protein